MQQDELTLEQKVRRECLEKLLGERISGDISPKEMEELIRIAEPMSRFILEGKPPITD